MKIEERTMLITAVSSFGDKSKKQFERIWVEAYVNTIEGNKKKHFYPKNTEGEPITLEEAESIFMEIFQYPIKESTFFKAYKPLNALESLYYLLCMVFNIAKALSLLENS